MNNLSFEPIRKAVEDCLFERINKPTNTQEGETILEEIYNKFNIPFPIRVRDIPYWSKAFEVKVSTYRGKVSQYIVPITWSSELAILPKKVKVTMDGIETIYNSLTDAASAIGIDLSTMSRRVRGLSSIPENHKYELVL